ncbi:actinia tenebrosa protease inhibitors-like isoform X1 [Parasteatoda tepidariorum]|uniref:actinia tenebrosa protease inhibitors-like isoform X1 n=1 Tax=Parasteatoda tepidariorum TaxID=114398 RepID=UPI0039BC24C0
MLLLLCMVSTIFADSPCPPHSQFNSCGTFCPVTCENFRTPPEFCIQVCKTGCVCESGYVLEEDGNCVLPENCANDNNVISQQTDKPDKCNLPVDSGLCHALFYNFAFNQTSGRCEEFAYGGCGGNANNFDTLEECEATCGDNVKIPQLPFACQQDKEVGTCDQNFSRFFYNMEISQCQEFIYAGCRGNSNNFQDLEDCEAVCQTDIVSRLPFACQQDKAVGPCDQNLARFFYNRDTAQCQEFIYGGCEGNDNNFQSLEDCKEICRVGMIPHLPQACQQEKEVGSCAQNFSRFFYNKEISQCQEFIYAGCEGNDNNFQDLEDCEAVCKTERD